MNKRTKTKKLELQLATIKLLETKNLEGVAGGISVICTEDAGGCNQRTFGGTCSCAPAGC
jgi:hypothetical protein